MELTSLEDVLVLQLGDLRDAERRIIGALPGMASAASDVKLRDAFETHLAESEEHLRRLEEVIERVDRPVPLDGSEAMAGLVADCDWVLAAEGHPKAKDAALISVAQRIEHYEIAAYGTARTLAEQLNLDEEAVILANTLREEHQADEMLSKLAVGGLLTAGINEQATSGQ